MVYQLITLGLVMFFLPVLFRFAIRLRLGIPMLYIVLALTVFHSWTQTHPALADGILFALVGLAALSWVVTGARKLCEIIGQWREDRAAAKLFVHQVRQARASGQYTVSSEKL